MLLVYFWRNKLRNWDLERGNQTNEKSIGRNSIIIQINIEDSWVSDSPYLHILDGLEQVHHQVEKQALEKVMLEIDYHTIRILDYMLPNRKKLVQIDFER